MSRTGRGDRGWPGRFDGARRLEGLDYAGREGLRHGFEQQEITRVGGIDAHAESSGAARLLDALRRDHVYHRSIERELRSIG
jgi:hypothetical protein